MTAALRYAPLHRTAPHQRGMTLVVVLMVLGIVSLLGASSLRITTSSERSARNDRDYQIAWQSSEAALLDAEMDILGQSHGDTARSHLFTREHTAVVAFTPNCDSSTEHQGLCAYTPTNTPAWLRVDFTARTTPTATTPFGNFTQRSFPAGRTGPRPAQSPRYIIEAIPDPSLARTTDPSAVPYVYRVTAMGFGPQPETQAVLQMLYRN